MSGKRVGQYLLEKRIGKGSYSQVWMGRDSSTSELVAVKAIPRGTGAETSQLRQEVAVLKSVRHRNIVMFKDLKKSSGHYYLVLEYCPGGDLAGFIASNRPVKEVVAQGFLRQLASGLVALHALKFIHRDLKPGNILMTDQTDRAILKIADFGFARELEPYQMAATVCGSPLYMAPEILRRERYDGKADLWSLGAIFYEMITGSCPFSGSNPLQLLANIEKGALRMNVPPEFKVSEGAKLVVRSVLARNPSDRISPKEFFCLEYVLGDSGSGPRHGEVLVSGSDFHTQRTDEEILEGWANIVPDEHEVDFPAEPKENDNSDEKTTIVVLKDQDAKPDITGPAKSGPSLAVAEPSSNNAASPVAIRDAPCSPPLTRVPTEPLDIPVKRRDNGSLEIHVRETLGGHSGGVTSAGLAGAPQPPYAANFGFSRTNVASPGALNAPGSQASPSYQASPSHQASPSSQASPQSQPSSGSKSSLSLFCQVPLDELVKRCLGPTPKIVFQTIRLAMDCSKSKVWASFGASLSIAIALRAVAMAAKCGYVDGAKHVHVAGICSAAFRKLAEAREAATDKYQVEILGRETTCLNAISQWALAGIPPRLHASEAPIQPSCASWVHKLVVCSLHESASLAAKEKSAHASEVVDMLSIALFLADLLQALSPSQSCVVLRGKVSKSLDAAKHAADNPES